MNKNILDRIKTVSSPTTQTPGLLQAKTGAELLYDAVRTWCVESREESEAVRAIVHLQLLYGLRVSEVLSIHGGVISFDGTIKIRVSKSDGYVFVRDDVFIDFWVGKVRNLGLNISYINRFYLYRLYKRKGFYILKSDNVNNSVTHSLRQLRASLIENQFNDKESVKAVLNHRSIKSSQYYGKNRE
jgi:integrase